MTDESLAGDPGLTQALDALIEIVKTANTGEAMQAQAILLRRLALQGDVTGSRVPPPRNITEIGGYLNYLEKLKQPEMRAQALAGIFGVAGPNPPLGWHTSTPPLSFVMMAAHRPEGPWQGSIPLSFQVRSDFRAAMADALQSVADAGASLPLLSSVPPLPPASGSASVGEDVLRYLGRVLHVVPAAALNDAATDAILLARPQGTTEPLMVMARVMSPGSSAVAPGDWDALECNATTCAMVAVAATSLIAIEPLLASAGFQRPTPAPVPASGIDPAWARFENRTGLVAGLTTLGDELELLYEPAKIAASVFYNRLSWVWNGETFA
jgi:hypothetical protein